MFILIYSQPRPHRHSNTASASSGFLHVSGCGYRDNVSRHKGLSSILRNPTETNRELRGKIKLPDWDACCASWSDDNDDAAAGTRMRVHAERMSMCVLQEGAVGREVWEVVENKRAAGAAELTQETRGCS